MRQIINGKMYNTETAIVMEEDWNGKTGLSYFCEVLYRKKNGEFFLHREGGALTSMAVSCPVNSTTGSQKIIPFTDEEAREWAEKHMAESDYTAIWGTPAE
jgi:hypothetical protein